MTLVTVLLLWLSFSALDAKVLLDGRQKLIIDQDGGGDDAMAIFEALIYEQFFNGPQVLAITTTHGNVDEDQVYINTQKFLDIADRQDIPIYRGSNASLVTDVPTDMFLGTDGISGASRSEPVQPIRAMPEHAAMALIKYSILYPGDVTIVALGALTNIALSIRLDPTFLSRVSTLYLATGREKSTPKFNVEHDVEAYHIVAQAATTDKITIVYYEGQINVTLDWRKNIFGSIPTKKVRALNEFERISFNLLQEEFWYLLDPIVMAAALDEEIIRQIRYSKNSVVLCGPQRGVLTNNYTAKDNANVKVYHQIDSKRYQTLLYSIFVVEEKNIRSISNKDAAQNRNTNGKVYRES